jgi:hypothetical protein
MLDKVKKSENECGLERVEVGGWKKGMGMLNEALYSSKQTLHAPTALFPCVGMLCMHFTSLFAIVCICRSLLYTRDH